MTLLDLMRSWDHLTMREVAMVEHFRQTWADESIAHAAIYPGDMTTPQWKAIGASGIGAERIVGYLGRNLRRPNAAPPPWLQ